MAGIGQYLHVYYPRRERATLLPCVDASEGHVADAVLTVGDIVRTEWYPAGRFLASSCIVAGGLAVVVPLPSAKLAAFLPGPLVQPDGTVTWF